MVAASFQHPALKVGLTLSLAFLVILLGVSSVIPPYSSWFLTFLPWIWIIMGLGISLVLVKERGLLTASIILVLAFALGGAMELAAVATGWPFGFFRYQSFLGPKILGLVPWSILAHWAVILVSSQIASYYLSHRWFKFVIGGFFLIVLDLVLDPAAVSLGVWHWLSPGWYYQVPDVSLIGGGATYLGVSWIMSRFLTSERTPLSYYQALLFWLTMLLWTTVALSHQLWGPGLIGLTFSTWLLSHLSHQPASLPVIVDDQPAILHKQVAYRQRKKALVTQRPE